MLTAEELKLIGNVLQHFVVTYGAKNFDVCGQAFTVATLVQRELNDLPRQEAAAAELAKFRKKLAEEEKARDAAAQVLPSIPAK